MKSRNRYLAFILVSVIILSLFPISVYSETSGIFTYYISDGTAVLTGVQSTFSGAVTIPDTMGGYPVSAINGAFRYRTRITSVTMPDSVTVIADNSFAYCNLLKNIELSPNLTEIGDSAFFNCNSLESMEIPDSVASIGSYAFSWCESLEAVTLPHNISTIAEGLFHGCSSLNNIDIPESATCIGEGAFSKTGYFDNSDNWENGALYVDGCLVSAKTDISSSYEIKKGTRLIADHAFDSCDSLESIVLYDSVKAIGDSAFCNCDCLTDVYYSGTYENRENTLIGDGNTYLTEADWHYGYCLAGDINDDGKVNNKDLMRLFKYLSNWDVVVRENMLDINGDGSINNKDMTRLFRYLSGWNVKIFYKNLSGETGGSSGGDEYGPIVIF